MYVLVCVSVCVCVCVCMYIRVCNIYGDVETTVLNDWKTKLAKLCDRYELRD